MVELLEGVDTDRCSLSLEDLCPVMGRCSIQKKLHRLEESYLESLAGVSIAELALDIQTTPVKKAKSSRKKTNV